MRATAPMLASTADAPFDDPAWAFELKWDGYRALALVTSDATTLRSRNGQDLTRRATRTCATCAGGSCARRRCWTARSWCSRPRARPTSPPWPRGAGPFAYVVFDLLHVDGEWIEDLPWRERRARLAEVVAPEGPPVLVLSDHVEGAGRALFAAAAERGLEGIMAKRMDAPYRPGRRVPDWRKIKTRQELEAVIGGFTEGAGSRRGTIGALLVGERGADGALTYLSHVGSGLSDALARELWDRLRATEVERSPFANAVPDAPAAPRWVRPELACEVRFAERTADGRLRAPVFHGLVDDGVGRRAPGPLLRGRRGPHGGGGRAAHHAHQPRQALLAARGHHQGGPARPLPAGGPGARAPPRGPPHDPQAVPQRHRRGLLLPAHGERRAALDARAPTCRAAGGPARRRATT